MEVIVKMAILLSISCLSLHCNRAFRFLIEGVQLGDDAERKKKISFGHCLNYGWRGGVCLKENVFL